MPRKFNNTVLNYFILIISCLICLVVSEILLRKFFPQRLITHYPGLCILDDVLSYKLKANWSGISSSPEYQHEIKINSTGFYDNEFPKKDDNVTKIVLLGDSFIFDAGNPYGKRLSEVLEEHLNSMDFIIKGNKKVDVLNLGVGGYDPYRYLLTWKQIGRKYKPDLVLLSFFAGNDYVGKPEKIIPEIPRGKYYGLKAILYPVNEFLEQRSHIYILVRTCCENIRVRLGLSDNYLPKIITSPDNALQEVLPVMEEIGEEFNNGPPLLIFQIPHRASVDEAYAKLIENANGIPFENLKFNAVQEAFKKVVIESHANSSVDLEESFKNNGKGKLYFPIDGHWNAQGVKVAANILLPKIEKILTLQLATEKQNSNGIWSIETYK